SSPLHPPCPPLFPYTTLFRSCLAAVPHGGEKAVRAVAVRPQPQIQGILLTPGTQATRLLDLQTLEQGRCRLRLEIRVGGAECLRSDEHSSELQSRENLVCRLL